VAFFVDETMDDTDTHILDEMQQFIGKETGCTFVARLITYWERAKWRAVVLRSPLDMDYMSAFLSAPGYEIGLVVLPNLKTTEDVVEFIRSLPEPRWKREKIDWEKSEPKSEPQTLLVGLKWILPDPKYITWAMGFGKFADEMPPMRKAPYTAIAVRLGGHWPGKKSIQRIDGRELVTFGDVPTLLDPRNKNERMKNFETTTENVDDLIKFHATHPMAGQLGAVAFSLPLKFHAELFGK